MTQASSGLDALFDEWESHYPGEFQRDGIVDEAMYRTALWKILFVTKEVNSNSPLKDIFFPGVANF
jgi:hypothetical protein